MPTCFLPLSLPDVMSKSRVAGFLLASSLIVPSSCCSPISNEYLSPLTDHLVMSSSSLGSVWPECSQETKVHSPSNFFTSSFSSFGPGAAVTSPAHRPNVTAITDSDFMTHLLRNGEVAPSG